jgi:hypothetical protein
MIDIIQGQITNALVEGRLGYRSLIARSVVRPHPFGQLFKIIDGDNRPFVPGLAMGPESSCVRDPIRQLQGKKASCTSHWLIWVEKYRSKSVP